jgi:hypothetical protein
MVSDGKVACTRKPNETWRYNVARAVILDFKDDQAAEKFVEMILDVQGNPNKGVPMDISMVAVAHAKIVALLPRPVRGCECNRKGRVQGWTRAASTGWYVCPQCFRPHKTVVRNWYVNLCMQSRNQLKKIKDKLAMEANPPEVVASDSLPGDVPSPGAPEGSVDNAS